jgi:hypothetical protein
MIGSRKPIALSARRSLRRCALAALLFTASAAVPLSLVRAQSTQASIVPATHSVYDWLQQQRVFGRLPGYEGEELPMSRGTILGHLLTLQRDSAKLSRTDRALLADFLNEFDFKRLEANGLFRKSLLKSLVADPPSGVIDEVLARRDPYLYAGTIGDSTITGALWVRKGWGEGWSGGAGVNDYAFLWTKGLRAFVNSSSGLGFHAEFDMAVANDAWIYRLDPRLGVNEQFLTDSTFPPTAYETWVSFQRKNLFIAMGKGAASFGPAVTDPLVLRVGAPSIGQLRISVGPPILHLTFMTGQLDGFAQTDTALVNGQPIVSTSPVPRWVALTRITWNPIPQFGFTLHQMTVYSLRGLDFEYLNPLLPALFGGRDKGGPTGSADNGFVGADIIGRPFKGTELTGSVLVDDAKGYAISPFGSDSAKLAINVSGEQRLPFDIRLGVSYTKIDAFVYTNHIATNAWTISGVPLGPAMGPNADEVAFRVTRWFPWRTRVMIGTRRIRKGLDVLDAHGNVVYISGGDLGEGENSGGTSTYGAFLAGSDLQTYRLDELAFESEPIRGLRVTAAMQSIVVIKGTRVPGAHTWFLRWSYGF